MIPLSKKPKIIKEEKNKATFEIEALYPGYGVTIGNSLRRVLLSSLEGAALTSVKIKGVSHEFSTISGVSEDVITIMLNLRQLRFKIFTDEPQKVTLKIKGEKEVKGSDLKIPTQLELVNKGAHIATMTTNKASLEMDIQVEKGVGYVPREALKKEKLEVGIIPLDAIFTPVRRVAFSVENMRVGKRTDYDRLFLKVETDGTISPKTAFSQASGILLKQFELFNQTFKEEKPVAKAKPLKTKTPKKEKKKKPVKKAKKTKREKKKKRKKT
ncbi:MAG: DNA-directed RNA polymerase subunit alpha [Patescibacteria group bacterium]|nr:DNA-directed RNA polymerase subunit alpha [Patescibacteria group bacterium]